MGISATKILDETIRECTNEILNLLECLIHNTSEVPGKYVEGTCSVAPHHPKFEEKAQELPDEEIIPHKEIIKSFKEEACALTNLICKMQNCKHWDEPGICIQPEITIGYEDEQSKAGITCKDYTSDYVYGKNSPNGGRYIIIREGTDGYIIASSHDVAVLLEKKMPIDDGKIYCIEDTQHNLNNISKWKLIAVWDEIKNAWYVIKNHRETNHELHLSST